MRANDNFFIPFALENTGLLVALIHPNHIAGLCSWGFFICRIPVIPMAFGIYLNLRLQ